MNSFRSATDPLGTASAYNCRRSPHKSILSRRAISFMKNEYSKTNENTQNNFRFSAGNVFPLAAFRMGMPWAEIKGRGVKVKGGKCVGGRHYKGCIYETFKWQGNGNATVECFPGSTHWEIQILSFRYKMQGASKTLPPRLRILWQAAWQRLIFHWGPYQEIGGSVVLWHINYSTNTCQWQWQRQEGRLQMGGWGWSCSATDQQVQLITLSVWVSTSLTAEASSGVSSGVKTPPPSFFVRVKCQSRGNRALAQNVW